MDTTNENLGHQPTSDSLLIEANSIYQEIDSLYQTSLGNMARLNHAAVERLTERLNQLMAEARAIDAGIAENLSLQPYPHETTRQLLDMRSDTISRLLAANKKFVAQAESVKALVRHEIGQMAKNHVALKGYRPTESTRKNIVQESY